MPVSFNSFIPNPKIGEIMQSTPTMVAHVGDLAQQVANAAIEEWNGMGPHPYESGDYVEGIKAEAGFSDDGIALGRVNAYDFKSWWIEMGTEDTPAFAPLRQGSDVVGLHLEAESGGSDG